MPPTKPKPPAKSTSTALVPTGPKEVFSKKAVRRDADGNKPVTARALVLRNGKYGSQGTGELVHMGKMSGREKLELLAGQCPHDRAAFDSDNAGAQRIWLREQSQRHSYSRSVSRLQIHNWQVRTTSSVS